MLDSVLSALAPHYCYGCHKPAKLLCIECNKYNNKNYNSVIFERLFLNNHNYEVKCVDLRIGVLKDLIDGYKFQRQKISFKVLAEILFFVFPAPADSIVITIPTRQKNKRARGYDHMKLIANRYAKLSKVKFSDMLNGDRKYSQHTKNLKERQQLAKNVFVVDKNTTIDKRSHLILVDDIYTTGSTMKEAVVALNQAGFYNIECIVIARQPFSVD